MIGLLSNSATLFLVKALLLGLRIVALLAIAKFGQSAELAAASYAIALAEMSRLLADWGTDTWAMRAIAMTSDANERSRLVTTILGIKAVGGLLCSVAIFVVCVVRFPDGGVRLGILAAVLLLSSQIAGLAITYFQALNRLREIIVLVLPCLLTMALTVAIIAVTGNTMICLGVLGIGEIFTAAILLGLLTSQRALSFASVSTLSFKRIARESSAAAAFGLIVGVYSRLDTLVLAQVSAAALATYTVANRLFLPFQVAVTTLGSIIYSSTSAALAANARTAARFYLGELPVTLGLSALASVLLWSGGHFVIGMYLPGFLDAKPVLDVLCLLLFVLGASSAVAARVLAHGRVRAIATIGALDLVSMIGAMAIMLPSYGPVGTAGALLVGACVNLCATLVYAYFTIERSTMPVLAK